MYDGKHKRAELIKELRSADNWKAASSNDQENMLINNYIVLIIYLLISGKTYKWSQLRSNNSVCRQTVKDLYFMFDSIATLYIGQLSRVLL